MAVMKAKCDDFFKMPCEKPQFPNWTWRFNRNQHMTSYYPWQIREEQKPPQYRNMGMHRNFRFHPMGPDDGPTPSIQLGVNMCHGLNSERQAGFGNASLGRTPGPAPPKLIAYDPSSVFTMDSLYRVNEIHGLTPGMSMHGYQPLVENRSDEGTVPLNPSHYLEQSLGQMADIPGSFPHYNKSLPLMSVRPKRECQMDSASGCKSQNMLDIWLSHYRGQQAAHQWQRCCENNTRFNVCTK